MRDHQGNNRIVVDQSGTVKNGLLDHIKSLFGVDTKFQAAVKTDLQQLKKDDEVVKQMIENLESSKYVITITQQHNSDKGNVTIPVNKDVTNKQGSIIKYAPNEDYLPFSIEYRPARIGLVHELGHADDLIQGKAINVGSRNDKSYISNKTKAESHPLEMENRIRQKLGLKPKTIEKYLYLKK